MGAKVATFEQYYNAEKRRRLRHTVTVAARREHCGEGATSPSVARAVRKVLQGGSR